MGLFQIRCRSELSCLIEELDAVPLDGKHIVVVSLQWRVLSHFSAWRLVAALRAVVLMLLLRALIVIVRLAVVLLAVVREDFGRRLLQVAPLEVHLVVAVFQVDFVLHETLESCGLGKVDSVGLRPGSVHLVLVRDVFVQFSERIPCESL